MYKHILVPIDPAHTEKAAAMLQLAKALSSTASQTTLLAVTAEIPGIVAAQLPPGALDQRQKEVKTTLQNLAAAGDAPVNVKVMTRVGSAHHEILAVAEDVGADLIIIGSHKPELQDYLLGSTAAQVVRHAPCSVHVIR